MQGRQAVKCRDDLAGAQARVDFEDVPQKDDSTAHRWLMVSARQSCLQSVHNQLRCGNKE